MLWHSPRLLVPYPAAAAAFLPRAIARGHHLLGQAWIHEPRTTPADFALICPRPLVAAKSLLHLATQAAFLFSMPFWAAAGVFTASNCRDYRCYSDDQLHCRCPPVGWPIVARTLTRVSKVKMAG